MPTVRDVFYDTLRVLGLTTIFGNPGSTEENFLTDFPDDFRFVLGLQEASVLAMADGYAQATGKPVFVSLHTAPGLGNAMGNILTAAMNKTPLIVTAGQQTREMLMLEPWLTNVDATRMAGPHMKWACEPARPEDLPAALVRAHSIAIQQPQGPVFLSLPLDDWKREVAVRPALRDVARRTAPDPAMIEQFAEFLTSARNPALVMGADIDRAGAWKAAIALAERCRATVFAPPASERAGFPEDHPQFAGALPFAIRPLCRRLDGHDVVAVIGAPVFRYYPFVPGEYLPNGTRLVHITDDPREAARAPVGDALVADSGLALQALLERIPQAVEREAPRPRRISGLMGQKADAQPMSADTLFSVMSQVLSPDTVLVEESPSNLAALHRQLPARQPSSFFTMASGGLGFGLPAAIGIALAEAATGRNRPVVAVIGDGSIQYSIQALATAATECVQLLIVVPFNREYAILKAFAKQQGTPGVPGLDLPQVDICSIARAYGLEASTAQTRHEVEARLRYAGTRRGPYLLVVDIDRTVPDLL